LTLAVVDDLNRYIPLIISGETASVTFGQETGWAAQVVGKRW